MFPGPAVIEAFLLGESKILFQGRLIPRLNTPRQISLLSFLILEAKPRKSRIEVAKTLWPEQAEAGGLRNLRVALYRLRTAWPELETVLQLDREMLYWQAGLTIESDVFRLETLLGAPPTADALHMMIELVRGPLLEGSAEVWIQRRQRVLNQKRIYWLRDASRLWEQQRNYSLARQALEELLKLNQEEPGGWRRMLTLCALEGNALKGEQVYAMALQAYQRSPHEREELTELYRRLSVRSSPASWPSSALVGRASEWEMLCRMWNKGGQAVVLLRGGMGIGKSSLALQFSRWVAAQGRVTSSVRCVDSMPLPYASLSELLRGLPLVDCPPRWKSELSRFVPELLDISPEIKIPSPIVNPWQKHALLRTISLATLKFAPLLLIDDVQFCDPDSLRWIISLVQQRGQGMVLLTLNTMAEPGAEVSALLETMMALPVGAQILDLSPLNDADSQQMVHHLTGELGPTSVAEICRHAEGNPLAIVELVTSGRDGALSDAFRRRLGQMSAEARAVAGIAAVLGRSFSMAGLQEVLPEWKVIIGLEALIAARFVVVASGDTYTFGHPILWKVADESMSVPRRAELHRKLTQSALHRDFRDTRNLGGLEMAFLADTAPLGYKVGGYMSESVVKSS